jgi:uncharacterized membrane protein
VASAEPTDVPVPAGAEDIGRVVALTDGVIAIAITLLVLEIAVPEIPDALVDERLGDALWELRPQVFGFVLSFVVIAYYWLSHRLVFSHLRSIDAALVGINLLFLLVIAFIPFVAALFADYAPNGLAVATYAAVMAIVGVSQLAIVIYPKAKGHFHPSVSLERISLVTRKVAVAPIVFIATIPIALVGGWVAIALWVTIPISRGVIARRAT